VDGIGKDFEAAFQSGGAVEERPQGRPLGVFCATCFRPSMPPPDLAARYRYALGELLRGSGLEGSLDDPFWADLLEPCDAAGYIFERPDRLSPADLKPHAAHGETAPVPIWRADDTPDLLASAFYWLAGLDELRTPHRDVHGRVRSADSLLVQSGCAERPIADVYRRWLLADAQAAGLEASDVDGWTFCPTHDLDALRKWRPGIVWREVGQRALNPRHREALSGRLARLGRAAWGVLSARDPYAASPLRLAAESARRGGQATLLFKADARSIYDVPYALPSTTLRALREQEHEIGLHPTYASFDDPAALGREAERLGLAGGFAHRAHYLRYDVRRSPGILQAAGVRADSTLGWADRAGFRRATARPFRLYDLLADAPTSVVEVPLVLMDGAVFDRQGASLGEAERLTRRLLEQVRRSGGAAAGLWHHHTFDVHDAPHWAEHFRHALDQAVAMGGQLATLSQAALSAE
jgi:hypothetical protein